LSNAVIRFSMTCGNCRRTSAVETSDSWSAADAASRFAREHAGCDGTANKIIGECSACHRAVRAFERSCPHCVGAEVRP